MVGKLVYLHLILANSKGQVKVIHTATVNISEMVTDGANITIAIIYKHDEVVSWLLLGILYGIFTFDLGPF